MAPAKRTIGKNDAVQIANAIRAFQVEYEKPPTSAMLDIITNVEGELLASLVARNKALNPREIVFIEVDPWKKNRGGIKDGIWRDPWGNPFRVSLDGNGDTNVLVSTNGEATGQAVVRGKVAVWNVSPNPKQQVRSWE